jgi:hypothetical protein
VKWTMLLAKSSKNETIVGKNELEYYSNRRISNSSLGWFKVSPKYYKLKLERELEEESKTYLEFGRQVHMAILEPNRFEKEFIPLDYKFPANPKQREFCELVAKNKKRLSVKEKAKQAYKAMYETKRKSGDRIQKDADALYKELRGYIKYLKESDSNRIVIRKSVWDAIHNTVTTVKNHKLANDLLFKNDYGVFEGGNLLVNNELPIYWDFALDDETTLLCKSLLDRLIIDHENKVIKLIDLKTAYSLSKFPTHFEEYGYHRQLAFYWLAVAWMFQTDFPEADFWEYQKQTYIVAVSTTPPDECKVYTITDKLLNDGLEEILHLSKEISWHVANDLWEYTRIYYEGDGSEQLVNS